MSAERFTNARVHEWLTPDLDATVNAMRTTRVQLNSAALWWFCQRLTLQERADILGEYVKVQAMVGSSQPPPAPPVSGAAPKKRRGRRPKSATSP